MSARVPLRDSRFPISVILRWLNGVLMEHLGGIRVGPWYPEMSQRITVCIFMTWLAAFYGFSPCFHATLFFFIENSPSKQFLFSFGDCYIYILCCQHICKNRLWKKVLGYIHKVKISTCSSSSSLIQSNSKQDTDFPVADWLLNNRGPFEGQHHPVHEMMATWAIRRAVRRYFWTP